VLLGIVGGVEIWSLPVRFSRRSIHNSCFLPALCD